MASASTAGAGGGRVEARAPVHMSFVVNGASGAARRATKFVRSAKDVAGVASASNVTVTRALARRGGLGRVGLGRALYFGRSNAALLMAQLKLFMRAAVSGRQLWSRASKYLDALR